MNPSFSFINNIPYLTLYFYYLHSSVSTTALTSSSSDGSSDDNEGRAGLEEAAVTQSEGINKEQKQRT